MSPGLICQNSFLGRFLACPRPHSPGLPALCLSTGQTHKGPISALDKSLLFPVRCVAHAASGLPTNPGLLWCSKHSFRSQWQSAACHYTPPAVSPLPGRLQTATAARTVSFQTCSALDHTSRKERDQQKVLLHVCTRARTGSTHCNFHIS